MSPLALEAVGVCGVCAGKGKQQGAPTGFDRDDGAAFGGVWCCSGLGFKVEFDANRSQSIESTRDVGGID